MNFLGNSNPNIPSEKGELDVSVMVALSLPGCVAGMWQSRFFDSLLQKLFGTLNTDELFGSGYVDLSCKDVMNSICHWIASMK